MMLTSACQGFRSLPRELREIVFNQLLEDMVYEFAKDSPVGEYDPSVIRVNIPNLPDYHTLKHRYPPFLASPLLATATLWLTKPRDPFLARNYHQLATVGQLLET